MEEKLFCSMKVFNLIKASKFYQKTARCEGATGRIPILVSLAFTLSANLLLAEQLIPPPNDAISPLEEILVTARKRKENLLEVPESLAAFSSTLIERANINGLGDIGLLVPNLYMSTRLDGFPNVSIRGIGGFGNTQGMGFYLDDAQLFSDASSRFGDLTRIEVLKGPQGILYGGSNIGGAIKFVTKRPDTEAFAGHFKLRAGEDSYFDGEMQLNIPLGADWAMGIFTFADSDDSYLNNPNSQRINGSSNNNDANIGKRERSGVRVSLAGPLTDSLAV